MNHPHGVTVPAPSFKGAGHRGIQPPPIPSFEYQHGALTGGSVLSPQQFHQDAEYRLRRTMNVGGSTAIHYNLKGSFSISTSIGQHARASTSQGGHSRVSRSIAGSGYYQRQVH